MRSTLVYEVNEAACELTGLAHEDLAELVGVLGDEMARAKEFVSG